jgi:Histidine kinase-, DNA gyrase B-, and HSP90-like ATPase
LDFTKINNLANIDSEDDLRGSTANLVGVFDLGVLLEEVVNTLYLEKHAASVSRNMGSSADEVMQLRNKSNGNLSVVLRITDQNDWKLQSVSGAWRRIIMNILGNALKYTEAGFIEVSLRKLRNESKSTTEFAHLSIIDSGHGMSTDFLKNKLFSPFAQEDSLSEGVGLGMSIVQQLVSLMKGTIDVKSESNVGTQVDIVIPIYCVPESPSISPSQTQIPDETRKTKFCLIGFNGYSELTEVPTGSLSREAKRRLCIQSLLAQIIASHPGWSVSFAETFNTACGDVAIVEEATLDQIIKGNSSLSVDDIKFTRLIVLSDIMPSSAVLDLKNKADIVSIHPP